MYGNWSSANTSIATVDYYGTHTGQGIGSTTSSTGGYLSAASRQTVCPNQFFGNSGGVDGNPSVSFSDIPYVVVGQTATTSATVTPSTNSKAISLSISPAAAVVSPTGTFTTNTSVQVKGLSGGSTATLNATVSNSDGSTPIIGTTSFPVTSAAPTATISQNTSGSYSSDDGAGLNYTARTGTSSLGPFTNAAKFKGCGIGFETVGTIIPSNYTGNVIIHRTFVTDQNWINSTEDPSQEKPPGFDDTSFTTFQDENPQSGGSAGKVYDLDSPGQHPPSIDGNTYRMRVNFSTYAALPGGTVISPAYNFYVRLSCTQTSSGYQFVNDVPGDNQIGPGSTKTTWNLQ